MNIRLLVDDLFVPSSKQPSVIYCRLTDFIPSLLVSSCPLRFICSSKMTNETSKPNPDTTRGGDQSCCFKPKNHNKFRFFS